jgi:hypothetical protein
MCFDKKLVDLLIEQDVMHLKAGEILQMRSIHESSGATV